MSVSLITSIANAVAEGSKVYYTILASKEVNRLKYRLEASMKYVFVDEKTGEFADADEKEIKKLKLHFRKRIFDAS